MKTDTKAKIISYLSEHKEATAKELASFLQISPQALFRQLIKLREQNKITKIGKAPQVFYRLASSLNQSEGEAEIDKNFQQIINQNYLLISPQGSIITGTTGFSYWCNKQNLPLDKTAGEYIKTLEKYNSFRADGLIDGKEKLKKTFDLVYLDEIYYFDFYSIERFGKTKLGTLVLFAKQMQNRQLMRRISDMINDKLISFIATNQVDAVGFIPPSIPRKIQLQKELQNNLQLNLPVIKIVKVMGDIPVSQKSLTKLEDRTDNAKNSIFIDDNRKFKNILLIDDAVGSGATLNETAKKIKEKGLCQEKIFGIALVGSFKGFDIINEI